MKKRKKVFAIIIALSMMLSMSSSVFAEDIHSSTGSRPYFPDENNLTTSESGAIFVMANGEYISFPDAQPEINSDNRTMVPFRAAVEALGYEVDWNRGSINAVCENVRVGFNIGNNTYTVTNGESFEKGTMDTAPYIKQNRTYIPIRFLAEAFNLEVLWNQDTRTVVIYDRAVMIENINKDFKLVNSWLGAYINNVPDSNEQAVSTVSNFSFCANISGEGENGVYSDYTFPLSGKIETLSKNDITNSTVDLDMGDFVETLADYARYSVSTSATKEEPQNANALIAALETHLSSLSMDIISSDTNVYVRCPNIIKLVNVLNELDIDDAEIPAIAVDEPYKAWLSLPVENISEVTKEWQVEETVGSLLVSFVENSSYTPEYIYEDALAAKDLLALFLGDDVFVKTGTGECYTAFYDYKEGQPYTDGRITSAETLVSHGISSLSGWVTINITDASISADITYGMYTGMPTDSIVSELDLSMSGEKADINAAVYITSTDFNADLSFNLTHIADTTTKTPNPAPGNNAIIISLEDFE